MSATITGRSRAVVVETIADVREKIAAARNRGCRIGFVPTMGALHTGHLSLMRAAREECDFVIVSIFVNPTQFGPNEDFQKYPRDLAADLRGCDEAGVDLVFHPNVETMYPPGDTTFVEVGGLSTILEGKFRPGHFRGVATVVLKLFNIVPADVAFFGQKDYQQQTIIRQMCSDVRLPIEIRVCPTIRETDGLALSSRNVFLQGQARQSALALSRCLNLAKQMVHERAQPVEGIRARMLETLASTPLVRPEYATLIHPDTLEEVTTLLPKVVAIVAARVGETRLIDNLIIEVE